MMFRGWGFLVGEMWVLLALAALVGLFAGWIIWGRRAVDTDAEAEDTRLRAALADCEAKGRASSAQVAGLERDLATAKAALAQALVTPAPALPAAAAGDAKASAGKPAAPKPAVAGPDLVSPAAVMPAPPKAEPATAAATTAATETPAAKVKPATLTAARAGKADDLKLIKGIGPKLETLCHKLGFYHFDQIAAWTEAEVAWVDENLEGFKGRVVRDGWVAQARDLTAGSPPRGGGPR